MGILNFLTMCIFVMLSISHLIAQELNVSQQRVDATIKLLDEGATVPFIARYRKEATQGLDDTLLDCYIDSLTIYTN